MRKGIVIAGAVVVSVALLGGAIWGLVMSLTAESRGVARDFVLLATDGKGREANALLHSTLAAELPPQELAEMFRGAAPYTDVRFHQIEANPGGTSLQGTARTVDGCSSRVSIEVLDGRIIAFDITPLCRQ